MRPVDRVGRRRRLFARVAHDLKRLHPVPNVVDADRPDGGVVGGADAARQMEVAQADVAFGRRTSLMSQNRARERTRDVGADLVLKLPKREAAHRQETVGD